jgi:EAL domain-containing protein (putative c-di-GMP-specific phosphodiesterase class I)/GGDEF domain-containing protein
MHTAELPLTADIPDGESLRLADLARYSVDMDQPEPDLMRLSAMLASMTHSPMAGVSLVDDRHIWIKGRYGVDVNCLNREGAFCGHAVESGCSLFVVPNAAEDARFEHNALVTGAPVVRLYAAALMRSPGGYVVGTVWIMDTRSREPSEDEREVLQAAAAYASQLLQLRRLNPDTSLPTRGAFIGRLQALVDALAALQPEAGPDTQPPSRIMVGHVALRNFALVRSSFGLATSHRVLKLLARRLIDWVQPGDIVAQLAGEALGFALLAPGADVSEHLRQLEDLLARPLEVDGAWIHVACQVGVTLAERRHANVSALIDQAEIAGSTGVPVESGPVRIYEAGTAQQTELWTEFQRRFPQDIADHRLLPCYQPQIDVQTGAIVGFEALARYRHPSLGLVSPGEFLQLARHTGLLRAVDVSMLKSVCADIAAWRREGHAVVPVSINFSRSTLAMSSVVDAVRDALAEHGLEPSVLVVEILEDDGSGDEALQETLDRLRDMGVRIALDDFGTGRSNLAALQSMNLHHLKVDRSFVHGSSANLHTGGVLRLLAGYSELSGTQLVCEGLENEADLQWALQAGCRYFQGWYFCAAVERDVVGRMLGLPRSPAGTPPEPRAIASALARCREQPASHG